MESLPPVDLQNAAIRLGSGRVKVLYPAALAAWFEGLTEPVTDAAGSDKWIRLLPGRKPGRFDVSAVDEVPTEDLELGAALATFWERVSFHLVDRLCDAAVFHAAMLSRRNAVILIPGQSGSGKTRLSLWYRAQGYALGTDELVAFAPGAARASEIVLEGALPRPVILKGESDASAAQNAGLSPLAHAASCYGYLMKLKGMGPTRSKAVRRGLIVFPQFKSGASLTLRALTPGEACLRLMESCLNGRNVARGGLGAAGALAGRLPAVVLEYGDTGQLTGTLDVLTRQAAAAGIAYDDLAALCQALSERRPARTTVLERSVPATTVERFPRRLSVGMATFDDFDGVYFTIQSIRLHHPEIASDLEYVVIDNNPTGVCSEALSRLAKSIDGCRYVPRGAWNGTAIKNAVFEEASSPFVLCVDSHVLIAPGGLAKLIAHFEADPDTSDLLQGPMMYDDLGHVSTHLEPQWRGGMYGTWATDPRGVDSSAPPFEIPMQGMGLFACRREAWPGFNPRFRGFGAEEGYIHEKVRQRGGRTLCLPYLRWLHRFPRPFGVPYVNRWEDRIRNYFIGFGELGLGTADMEAHFSELLGKGNFARVLADLQLDTRVGEPQLSSRRADDANAPTRSGITSRRQLG